MRIIFKTVLKECPDCNKTLKAYRTEIRHVISADNIFTAVHRIEKCRKCTKLFRSEALDKMIEPYCTYANDIMIDVAMKRFIDGRSCGEISRESGYGISERQARNLSNMALDIMGAIHDESFQVIRNSFGVDASYILQIDGTVDGDFAMIVVVRDAVSGFTLYSEKCFSESDQSITGILKRIRERFGNPSGTISDMRAGTLKAIKKMFPGIPVRICLLHFLRDLGKDLMGNMHTDLGIMITRMGIKSRIKKIFMGLPEYDRKCLHEIASGFCTDTPAMEMMSIRRVLEPLTATGSSGYGFPFSLRHFNFYNACVHAKREIDDLNTVMKDNDALDILKELSDLIMKVTENSAIREMASRLGSINATFQGLRMAFHLPEKGSLSGDAGHDRISHDSCDIFIGQMKEMIKIGVSIHEVNTAKQIIDAYEKWEGHLFAQNKDGTIPRTNNSLEQFFRKIRRNVRKRTGNLATGRLLSHNGDKLAIFQNMGIPDYMKIVFGSTGVATRFASYRKGLRKHMNWAMTRKKMLELVDKGMEGLKSGTLRKDPYSDELMEMSFPAEKTRSVPGV